jgi:hypothetical protein
LSRSPRSRTGSRRRGKKAHALVQGDWFLDGALKDFSGYIAADEIYDGPFCILFIVDNRNFNRIIYDVLERNPTKDDVKAFFRRFRALLDARGLKVVGVTTDGSPLYPDAITESFPGAAHQLCGFHVVKEIMAAVLQALAQVRKELKRQIPKLPRGRPSTKEAKRLARKAERIRRKISDLFDNRHLFVRHDLTDGQKKTLARITRGRRDLRTLRPIVDEVYRLFDRRCCTETALKKLAALRRRVRRFKTVRHALKKLWSPDLEKALTFLDDKLLPATSNAVERANRRHRKMQKTVYRVRTKAHVEARVAMDMLRESRTRGRAEVVSALHRTRTRAPRIDIRLLKRRRRTPARRRDSASSAPATRLRRTG